MFLTASAFDHFEKYFVAINMYFLYPVVLGKGSRMLNPHWEKGQGAEMLDWGIAGVLIALPNC